MRGEAGRGPERAETSPSLLAVGSSVNAWEQELRKSLWGLEAEEKPGSELLIYLLLLSAPADWSRPVCAMELCSPQPPSPTGLTPGHRGVSGPAFPRWCHLQALGRKSVRLPATEHHCVPQAQRRQAALQRPSEGHLIMVSPLYLEDNRGSQRLRILPEATPSEGWG